MDDSAFAPTAAVLRRLLATLAAAGFAGTEGIPVAGGPLDLLLDPLNAVRSLSGRSNLLQPTALPGLHRRLLVRARPAAVALHRLLTAGEARPRDEIEPLLGDLLPALIDVGALVEDATRLRSEIVVVPYRGRCYVSDAVRHQHRHDFCYLGRASFAATDLALAEQPPGSARRLLDLGCGSAVGALALSSLAGEIVGSDVAPRAIRFARLNAALHDVAHADFVVSDLTEDVTGTFDLIVTHPPGGWSGTDPRAGVVAADGGGDFGLELPERMIRAALERIRSGGAVYAVLFAPVLAGGPYASTVVRRICADRPAEVVLHPYLEYYELADAARHRAFGVRKLVRYLAVFRPAAATTVRFETLDRPRLLSSRLRTLPARLAGRLSRRGG